MQRNKFTVCCEIPLRVERKNHEFQKTSVNVN